MRYDAVIFDLFGTLVEPIVKAEYDAVLREMAEVLDVDATGFVRLWEVDTSIPRNVGEYQTIQANVEHICAMLDEHPDAAALERAVAIRHTYTRGALRPWPDAASTLDHIKRAGHKLGLVSDCSADVPPFWPETGLDGFFDVAVFSCLEGVKKPDPRIYKAAYTALDVQPERCLFVGDGGSYELTGAAAVGMDAVLIRVEHESNLDARRPEEDDWSGPCVSTLTDLLDLIQ